MANRKDTPATPIPADVALRLCEEIREAQRGKAYTFTGLWCLFCARFSATPAQRCFANPRQPGNRGCGQVNARFGALHGAGDR